MGSAPKSLLAVKLAVATVCLAVVIGAGIFLGSGQSSDADSDFTTDPVEAVAAREDAPGQANPPAAANTVATSAKSQQTTSGGGTPAGSSSNPDRSTRPPELPEAPAATGGLPARPRPQDNIPAVGIPQLDFGFEAAASDVARGDQERPPASRNNPVRADSQRPPPSPEEAPAPPASTVTRMAIARVNADDATSNAGRRSDPVESLSLPLAELALEETSVVEFVRLVSDLTGTTITVTPQAHHLLQEAAPDTVTLTQSATTAGGALRLVLQQFALRLDESGGYLVIVPADAAGAGDINGGVTGPLSEKLGQFVTFSFTAPTPLDEVLRYVERTSGVTLLVDWPSLASVQLGPASLVTVSVVNQPLRDVLDELLPQAGMRWAPVGNEAVWITGK